METVLIILAIIWVIIPLAMKKKQQQAKAEAERQRAARQHAPQPAVQQRAPQQPMRTTPLAPNVRPSQGGFQPSFEGLGSHEGTDGSVVQGEKPHDVMINLTQAKSTLAEAKTSITHTVTVSSESGHAHEETSATGIEQDCPPDAPQMTQPIPQSADSAYVWNVEQARSGLVMAEILGPCLALRD